VSGSDAPAQGLPIGSSELERLTRAAGTVALHARPADTRSVRRVAEAVEATIAADLEPLAPEVALTRLSEPMRGRAGGWSLRVDPIDGLDAYVCGLPTWAVVLGVFEGEIARLAAVFAPALEDFYLADHAGLRWGAEPVPSGGLEESGQATVLGTGLGRGSILRLRREARGPVFYHACLVARGAADAAVLGRLGSAESALVKALVASSEADVTEHDLAATKKTVRRASRSASRALVVLRSGVSPEILTGLPR
jgi:fructose-1,6-bisphosphatase/inositol monophosphatase family enzyme